MAYLSLLLFTFTLWKCQIDHKLSTMHAGFPTVSLGARMSRLALLLIS